MEKHRSQEAEKKRSRKSRKAKANSGEAEKPGVAQKQNSNEAGNQKSNKKYPGKSRNIIEMIFNPKYHHIFPWWFPYYHPNIKYPQYYIILSNDIILNIPNIIMMVTPSYPHLRHVGLAAQFDIFLSPWRENRSKGPVVICVCVCLQWYTHILSYQFMT